MSQTCPLSSLTLTWGRSGLDKNQGPREHNHFRHNTYHFWVPSLDHFIINLQPVDKSYRTYYFLYLQLEYKLAQ